MPKLLFLYPEGALGVVSKTMAGSWSEQIRRTTISNCILKYAQRLERQSDQQVMIEVLDTETLKNEACVMGLIRGSTGRVYISWHRSLSDEPGGADLVETGSLYVALRDVLQTPVPITANQDRLQSLYERSKSVFQEAAFKSVYNMSDGVEAVVDLVLAEVTKES